MMLRAAIALIALVVPAYAQHGGAHAGSSGSRGFSGHGGFSGSSGFSHSSGSARPAPPVRYGALGSTGFRAIAPPRYTNFRTPYNGNRSTAFRPPYDPRGNGASRGGDRVPYGGRRHSGGNWYVYSYPPGLGYGYPYLIDPGFYDWGWGDSDDSGDDSSAYDQGAAPYPEYAAPYPEEGYGSVQPAEAEPGTSSAPVPEQPLTVIFNNGRAPVKVQNYMMTSRVLTDLDSQHYEQIPLGEIDLAATQQANSAAGVEFQIPGASRE